MAKVGEKGFSIGKIYENRHNHRFIIVQKKEISDEGVVLYQLKDWDLMNPDSNSVTWVAESARKHWIIASRVVGDYEVTNGTNVRFKPTHLQLKGGEEE